MGLAQLLLQLATQLIPIIRDSLKSNPNVTDEEILAKLQFDATRIEAEGQAWLDSHKES